METYAFAETGTRITRWLFCSVNWFSVTTILPQASDRPQIEKFLKKPQNGTSTTALILSRLWNHGKGYDKVSICRVFRGVRRLPLFCSGDCRGKHPCLGMKCRRGRDAGVHTFGVRRPRRDRIATTFRTLLLLGRFSSEPCRLSSRPGRLRPGSDCSWRVRPALSLCPSLRATSLLLGPSCCSS